MDVKRSLLTGILVAAVQVLLQAQQPAGYYNSAAGKSGEQLQQALHAIIDNHSPQSYSYLWTAFKTTDKKPDGTVWDMYSDNPYGAEPYVYTFGDDQCGNYSGEGSCYNREHSFPKSWFGGEIPPMTSDLFHLYPTDGKVNGNRSNHPFGETNSPDWTSLNGSKVGSCSVAGYSGTIFEPIDEYKGDFARTYFYMATRYYGEDSGWPGSDMVDGSQLKPWAEDMLLLWHNDDLVSQKELDRNDAVYGFQGNRNPFIDKPEYVELLYIGELAPQPECNNDIVSMTGGSSFSYLVLYNDNIPGSGTLSINKQPTHGTAEVESGNTITYSPNPEFNQQYDTIGYKVCLVSNPLACDSALMIVHVDKAVGIETYANDSKLTIYPNPNQGDFHIKYSGNPSDIQTVTVRDMSGRNLPLDYTESGEGIRITTRLKPGLYHLGLTHNNGRSFWSPLLVQ